ncbi:MAG: DUF1127 domain-containing protein [Rhodobacteraceae bacterium]|nr:DUF1127 domain-containing protein [Paracoccaceae bacterium]
MTYAVTPLPRMTKRPRGLFRRLADAFHLRSQRLRLMQLTDQQLADIGLTRADAEAEARRSLWDAPSHWKG